MQLIAFINLFLVPILALRIYCKREGLEFKISLEMFLRYCLMVPINMLVTKAGIFLIGKAAAKTISYNGAWGTLVAVSAAVLWPYMYEAWKASEGSAILLPKKEKYHELPYREKFFTSFCVMLLPGISYVLLGPLEIYYGNSSDFVFSLRDFIGYLVIVFIVIMLVGSFLVALVPNRYYRAVTAILFWFGVVSYLQYMFMNVKLSEMDGSAMDWESLGKFPAFNLLVWLILLVVILYICKSVKSWFSLARMIPLALCVMPIAAILTLVLTAETQEQDKDNPIYISGANQFKVAAGDNVVVFILDAFGNGVYEEMLELHPEKSDVLKDFTFYDNANTHYYASFPSVSYFMTAYEVDFGGGGSRVVHSCMEFRTRKCLL